MPPENEIIIGDFFPQPASGSRVFVSIYATNRISGVVEIRDSENQVCHSQAFDLEKEGDALEVDISHLPTDDYLVHLSILGKRWERKMWVRR